jgi:hypothetical protein
MKQTRLATLVIFLCGLLIYFSCKKSDSSPATYQPEYVNAVVSGRVVDDNNVPVEGATIKAGSSTTSTDVNGQFKLTGVTLDKKAGFVKAEKAGFFLGSRTIAVNTGGVNHVSIQLIKKTVAGNFNGSSGGTITVPSGGSIQFPATGVINTAGNTAYTGTVNVSAYFINPSAPNFAEIMPGALLGINNNNQQTGLQSFGMMAVELTGTGGEKLQLSTGKTATILFPIPAGLQAQAPATIPLWSLDETTGLWKEEGTANKQGSNYVGAVSHFSFWNCDAPFTVVDFKAVIKDQNNAPLPGARVVLKTAGDTLALSGVGYTDSAGKVTGKVPSGKTLTMQVHNRCGGLIHTQNIGPFSTDTDLGTVTVTNSSGGTVVISGTAVNCSGNPLANGQVNVFLDGINHRTPVNNGNFTISISRCITTAATAQLIAIDMANTQQGPATNVAVTSGTASAGQLTACGTSLSQFINYTINNVNYSYQPGADSLMAYSKNGNTSIQAYPNSQTNWRFANLAFEGQTTGTVNLQQANFYINNKYWIKDGSMNVQVTEYGTVGEFIAGNFSGNVHDSANTTIVVPVTCNFRVKRHP